MNLNKNKFHLYMHIVVIILLIATINNVVNFIHLTTYLLLVVVNVLFAKYYKSELNKKRTYSIQFGLRSKYQSPLFMIWRENYDQNKEVEFAVELFSTDHPFRWLRNILKKIEVTK